MLINSMIISRENYIGAWAFLVGVILAFTIGIAAAFLPLSALSQYTTAIYSTLIILGLIVGFMNVSAKDVQTFMIAGIVLVIASKFGMDSVSGSLIGFSISDVVRTVFSALLTLFVPATIVVALKTVFSISRV